VTVTLLDKCGHNLSFMAWCKSGVPVTLLTVGVANLYMLRYAL
jgi:Na+/H+ antiporter NhaD/arsenite permease-like protein